MPPAECGSRTISLGWVAQLRDPLVPASVSGSGSLCVFRTRLAGAQDRRAMPHVGGVFGTAFSVDPKEQLVTVNMTHGASARLQSRHLFKNIVYGAMVG